MKNEVDSVQGFVIYKEKKKQKLSAGDPSAPVDIECHHLHVFIHPFIYTIYHVTRRMFWVLSARRCEPGTELIVVQLCMERNKNNKPGGPPPRLGASGGGEPSEVAEVKYDGDESQTAVPPPPPPVWLA